ncbi:MAG: YkgJ family cysteine cluster protein [Planctomycetota bacterium]|nr:YkgJ family cysteine cluster protein [Planctomycetota bacterium]
MIDEHIEFPWYQSGLAFECTQCGNCCSGPETGYVWVTDEEIDRLAVAMDMEDDVEGFKQKFVRQVLASQSLVEYSDGDCIFLDPKTRECMVYEARPVQCRTWPFWPQTVSSPADWARAAKGCPGCNHGPVYELPTIAAHLDSTIKHQLPQA